jgi:Flp pilus assembly protein TadD/O-antigen ligase
VSSDASTEGVQIDEQAGERRRHRVSHRRHGTTAVLVEGGTFLGILVTVAAPLAVGGVHRWVMVALMGGALVALVALVAGLTLQGRTLRTGMAVVLPFVFVAIPLLQSIPLPLALRSGVDPNGTALLQENQVVPTKNWSLSLDPPNTRVNIGRAAAALAVFLIAYHLASGKSRRQLLLRAIGVAGVVAVAIGLGHRMLGFGRLFGVFHVTPRALLAGPFVNPNHTAEFLELAAFVCLACSFQRPTMLNRVGWLVGTLLCSGGAAATLSRGAVMALVMATLLFTVLRYRSLDTGSSGRRRSSLAWGGLLLGVIVIGAAALGAGQLVDRFKADAVSTDVRLQLWRQSLHVLAAHPFGIGRGAFDRVFPIYRSFTMPFSLRFAFVENEPLQLLIDCGWFFYSLLVVASGVVVWQLIRNGRRDKIEAALVAGLFAVLIHNLVDFGFETLGIVLPFMAVLATVTGRLAPLDQHRRFRAGLSAFAAAALIAGIAFTAHRSYDDFDALLKKRSPPSQERELVLRAEATHPLDYFYALTQARLEPLRAPSGGPSPRLHALNRALRLCPFCETVHEEVARNLWHLGLRRQSLLEWRTAVDLQPHLFMPLVGELFSSGATPEELAAVASSSSTRMLDLVSVLQKQGRSSAAFMALTQAEAMGAPRGSLLIVQAGLELDAKKLDSAVSTLHQAEQMGVQDPRLAVLEARLLTAQAGANGADEAIAALDRGAARYPSDLSIQRMRLDLVMRYEKWNAASRSLEGLKSVLYQQAGTATEAHIDGARIARRLGHWTAALDEYSIALAERPTDVSLWMEYGKCAASIGRIATARDAYQRAAELSPNSPDVVNARHELDDELVRLRASSAPGADPSH